MSGEWLPLCLAFHRRDMFSRGVHDWHEHCRHMLLLTTTYAVALDHLQPASPQAQLCTLALLSLRWHTASCPACTTCAAIHPTELVLVRTSAHARYVARGSGGGRDGPAMWRGWGFVRCERVGGAEADGE